MSILILQHAPHCSPGRLGLCLRDHGFDIDLRRLDLPNDHAFHHSSGNVGVRANPRLGVPSSLDGIEGVVSLGGPMNVGDNLPWMSQELAFLKAAHSANLPIVGICLGHQLIAHALGGSVGPMDKPEQGFHNISINPVGQIDTLLAGLAWDHPQYQSHGQEVKQLPPGASLLASSAACKNQIFKAGVRTYGFQFHFEVDQHMIAQFDRCEPGIAQWAHTAQATQGQPAEAAYPAFARLSDRLCVNIAAFLFNSP